MNLIYRRITWVLFFLGAFGMTASAQENILRFTVLDEDNKFFTGLQPQDLRIKGSQGDLKIDRLSANSAASLEVIILIDISVSQQRAIADEKAAISYFIDNVLHGGQDKVAIAQFSGSLALAQDLTTDREKAKAALGMITVEIPPPGVLGSGPGGKLTEAEVRQLLKNPPPAPKGPIPGATSMWDTVKRAVEVMAALKPNGTRRAIVMVTDGVNTSGDTKIREAIEFAILNGIPVYAIGIGDDFYSGVDKKTLIRLAEETGGIAIFPQRRLGDLRIAMDDVKESLHSYYEAAFSQNISGGGNKVQEIKIEFLDSGLKLRKLRIIQPKGPVPAK